LRTYGTAGLDWWSAGPNEKADQGIYDDRLTFSNTNDYVYSAGEDGNTFVNAGISSLGVAGAGSDYSIPLVGQYGMLAEGKYALGYDDASQTETITLPAHMLFPYIAHQAQFDEAYTFRILSIDSKYMELGARPAWHRMALLAHQRRRPCALYRLRPRQSELADASSDLNLAKGLNSVGSMVFWWANADWAQQADPTFAYADGVYSITAPYATAVQWQAQCSIHNGGVDLKAGQAYDISVTLVASEAFENATVKVCQKTTTTTRYSMPVP
jgi:hypothetical protein